MITEHKGNILEFLQEDKIEVLVHGCNCFKIMGAGLAKQIKIVYPKAYKADIDYKVGRPIEKLGNYSAFKLPNLRGKIRDKYVVNAYTQFNPGANFDINALISVLKIIKRDFGKRVIGFPQIGAGIGGGNWNEIKTAIIAEFGYTKNEVKIIYYNVDTNRK